MTVDAFIQARDNNLDFFYNNPIILDIQDEVGQSLLHYAIRGNATEVVFYLLENHINTNLKNSRGETALFEAIRKGKLDIVMALIKHFTDVNITNFRGESPLMLASQKGNIEIISVLLENGANPKVRNQKGESILFYALRSHLRHVYDYVRMLSPDLRKTDFKDNSLLHSSAEMGSVLMVQHLLSLDENPHHKNNLKETPIFAAARRGDTYMLQILVSSGAYIDVKNKYGKTIFDIAHENEDYNVIDFIESHQQSSLYNKNIEKYPLRHAVVKADNDLLRSLIYAGLQDKKDEYNLHAYDYAKRQKEKEILITLDDIH